MFRQLGIRHVIRLVACSHPKRILNIFVVLDNSNNSKYNLVKGLHIHIAHCIAPHIHSYGWKCGIWRRPLAFWLAELRYVSMLCKCVCAGLKTVGNNVSVILNYQQTVLLSCRIFLINNCENISMGLKCNWKTFSGCIGCQNCSMKLRFPNSDAKPQLQILIF